MTLIFKNSFFFPDFHCFETSLWLLLQLLQSKLFLQLSSVWSGSCAPHFTHTSFLEQTFFKYPYFWPLWHLLGFGIYFSTFADIYPIFISDGSFGLVWFVGFYGISTFVGYLMPNPFLCK